MRNLFTVSMTVVLSFLSTQALAGTCQQVVEAAALSEMHKLFPSSGGRTRVNSVSINKTSASVMVENQNINDLPMEVDVPITQTGGGNCRVTGEPEFVGGDNS